MTAIRNTGKRKAPPLSIDTGVRSPRTRNVSGNISDNRPGTGGETSSQGYQREENLRREQGRSSPQTFNLASCFNKNGELLTQPRRKDDPARADEAATPRESIEFVMKELNLSGRELKRGAKIDNSTISYMMAGKINYNQGHKDKFDPFVDERARKMGKNISSRDIPTTADHIIPANMRKFFEVKNGRTFLKKHEELEGFHGSECKINRDELKNLGKSSNILTFDGQTRAVSTYQLVQRCETQLSNEAAIFFNGATGRTGSDQIEPDITLLQRMVERESHSDQRSPLERDNAGSQSVLGSQESSPHSSSTQVNSPHHSQAQSLPSQSPVPSPSPSPNRISEKEREVAELLAGWGDAQVRDTHIQTGDIKGLLQLHSQGKHVTAEHLLAAQRNGGSITLSDLSAFVEQGGVVDERLVAVLGNKNSV